MSKLLTRTALVALAVVLATGAAFADKQTVSFKDPTGDDKGPGAYIYPTDTVYKAGSFDLVGLDVESDGKKVNFEVTVNSTLEDPWGMKTGFAVQMIFIFIDTDHKEGSGFTKGLPGLNVEFAPADAWDHAIILSPQGSSRVKSEVESKAAAMQSAILVPNRTKGSGRSISGSVELEGDPSTWGYQVVVQSNEGFPADTDLLTRKVNEYEGQHRFGGGDDSDCDPHVMDVLAGAGAGEDAEAQAQFDMLKYDCAAGKPAVLTMVRKG